MGKKLKNTYLNIGLVLSLILLLQINNVFGASALLSWNAPTANDDGTPLTDLAGYYVHYGTSPRNYSDHIDVGKVVTYSVNNLSTGVTYYFSTTAYDTSGNESAYSNEVSAAFQPVDTLPPVTVSYYCDNDGDGFTGQLIDGTCSGTGCEPAGCRLTPGNDCNDNDPYINPEAVDDTCDGIDDNCNGAEDEGYVTAAVSCGEGVCTSVGQILCQAGKEVNTCTPGLPAEDPETTCSDGLDNDCDGQIDEGCVPVIEITNVLLSEDFSSGIPASWPVHGAWNTRNECGRTPGHPFAGAFAISDSSCRVTDSEELITASFDTLSCSSVRLAFSNQYYWYSGSIEVDVSGDGGSTWTPNISLRDDDGFPDPDWKELDISAVSAVSNAKVRFRYANNSADGFWALDNVWVTCQADQMHIASPIQVPAAKTVMIGNTGTANLAINMISKAGPDAPGFTIGENDGCSNRTLLPAESCTFDVVFTPSSTGLKTATLSVSSNDPDMPVYDITVTGTGTDTLDPVPLIKINGLDGVVDIARGDNSTVTIELDPGSYNGKEADWWVLMEYRKRWYYYNAAIGKWRRGYSSYRQSIPDNAGPFEILNSSRLSRGMYTLYFGVDTSMGDVFDSSLIYYDTAVLNIQ